MKKLLVLGLDGASWSAINPVLHDMPTFRRIIEKGTAVTLRCNIVPVHSAPSWTTIFTGVKPELHGIIDFKKSGGSFFKREDLHYPFVWETLFKRGIDARALHILCFVPALNYRLTFPFSVGYRLRWSISIPITYEECMSSLKIIGDKTIEVLKQERPDFLAVVFPHIDKLSHVLYNRREIIERAYIETDRYLEKLFQTIGDDYSVWIISDHGMTDVETSFRLGISGEKKGKKGFYGDHHPDGIFLTPEKIDLTNPIYVTDIAPLILKFFKVNKL